MVEQLIPKKIIIPDFGDTQVVRAVNASGCVDPRNSATFVEPVGKLARLIGHTPDIQPRIERPHHVVGAERTPGASAGRVMTLLATEPKMQVSEAVDLVAAWDSINGRPFTIHEDVSPNKLGCGHVDRAALEENEALYGLPAGKVQEMKEDILERAKAGELTVAAPVLLGSHGEEGVLVVKGAAHTVDPQIGDHEFFRYDAVRDQRSLASLGEFVRGLGYVIETDTLVAAAERQRNATLSLLAPELPIFTVDLTPGKQLQERVVFSGTVPAQ